jgi:ornithine cyclodeaminase/alanine dehydrogenase-like protein (mu-crystallin family)
MPPYFDEAHCRAKVDMPAAIPAMREAFARQAQENVVNIPRVRAKALGKSLNVTGASDATLDRYAVKIYGGGNFHILLYSRRDGLLAIMEADWLGQLRTGATNALAASLMARPGARKVGLIGAGRQALAQALALDSAGLLEELAVHARRPESRDAFCERLSRMTKARIRPVESAEAAARGADIVITATTSEIPVLMREWLSSGAHVNAMGANAGSRMELDPAIITDAACLATDDVSQARQEAAEFLFFCERFDWARVQPLSRLAANPPPRGVDDITVFKSLGAGLEDLAIASLLYDASVR